jgi:hypothetical protein
MRNTTDREPHTLDVFQQDQQPALAAHCQQGQPLAFAYGMSSLKTALGETMGVPLDCKYDNDSPPNGDKIQHTTAGLAYWRKVTNNPSFPMATGIGHSPGPD